MRGLLITTFSAFASSGSLDVYGKIEQFWRSYYVSSTFSNFATVGDLLQYWAHLPVTIMAPEYRRYEYMSTFSVLPGVFRTGYNMLSSELEPWATQLDAQGVAWNQWKVDCQARSSSSSSSSPRCANQAEYNHWLRQQTATLQKAQASYYAVAGTEKEAAAVAKYFQSFFNTSTPDAATGLLQLLYQNYQQSYLAVFSEFMGRPDSWYSHLTRLNDAARNSELRWLALGIALDPPRRISPADYQMALEARCENLPNLTTINQYFQHSPDASNGQDRILMLPKIGDEPNGFVPLCLTLSIFLREHIKGRIQTAMPCKDTSGTERKRFDEPAKFVFIPGLGEVQRQLQIDLPEDGVFVPYPDWQRFVEDSMYAQAYTLDPYFRIFQISPNDAPSFSHVNSRWTMLVDTSQDI